jgi:23S rRNA (adenine2030-N6)-methyltransferase
MNYRHHYHAGNFADVMKHALFLELLEALQQQAPQGVLVFDTHAGAGVYDLEGPMALKSLEAERGIVRLAADRLAPAPLQRLIRRVEAANPQGGLRYYPGSPMLALAALRPRDLYLGCEAREDDADALDRLLAASRGGGQVRAFAGDGYQVLSETAPPAGRRSLVLIDPPYERGDEADQIVEAAGRRLALEPHGCLLIWAPLKDLESFDGLLRRLEDLQPAALTASEARLRPWSDPMKMNGSAMIQIGGPDVSRQALQVCQWIAAACGEADAAARVRRLAG